MAYVLPGEAGYAWGPALHGSSSLTLPHPAAVGTKVRSKSVCTYCFLTEEDYAAVVTLVIIVFNSSQVSVHLFLLSTLLV